METYERITDTPLSPDFEALSTLFKCATQGNIHGQDEAYLSVHAAISQRDSLLSVQKQLVEALKASEFILSMIVKHGQYKPLDVSAVKALHNSARAAILAAKASS